jgi:adenylate kinase family enzyme
VTGRRILIGGAPRTGKSTLALKLAAELGLDPLAVQPTDDLAGVLEWSEASAEAMHWLEQSGPWIVEGTMAVRALRKWLVAHQEGQPYDEFIWLTAPFVPLNKGQSAMAKGAETILKGIVPELAARGLTVTRR